MASCANTLFVINQAQCSGACVAIADNQTYSQPSCVTNPQFSTIYQQLRSSYDSNLNTIGKFVTDLDGNPKSNFITMLTKLKSIVTNY